jgi:biotin carboxylase
MTEAMPPRPRLLLVMPYRQLVDKARSEGFWVASIWDARLESAQYLADVQEKSDVFVLTNFSDEPELRRVIQDTARTHGVSTIYHIGREDSMLATYDAAEQLAAELNPVSAVRLLVDKGAMRDRLAERGLSPVRYAKAEDRAQVPAALAQVGYPAVVKPTALAGSRGVFLWHGSEDAQAWSVAVEHYDYGGPFIVEEYLEGPEYSVETLSRDGVHHVIGITEKQLGPPPLFVEIGHVHPAPLTDERRQAIEDLTRELLTACDYRFGPAHTEVIWTSHGPRVVESQARLGGDRIPRLVQLSSGLDLERAIFTTLAGRPLGPVEHLRTALVRFFAFPPGLVLHVQGLDTVAALDYVDELRLDVAAGECAPPVRDSKTRHGHIIVTGDTVAQAREHLDHAMSLLQVVVEDIAGGASPGRGTERRSA